MDVLCVLIQIFGILQRFRINDQDLLVIRELWSDIHRISDIRKPIDFSGIAVKADDPLASEIDHHGIVRRTV